MRGVVTLEENGDFVRGAVILVIGAGAFALTDERGGFEIDGVPAGSYEVVAQREHLTAGRQTVTVEPRGVVTADFELALSPVHEDVTVTASPGGTETAIEAFNAVSTLDAFDIARESASSLGDVLQGEPGDERAVSEPHVFHQGSGPEMGRGTRVNFRIAITVW